MEKCNKCSAISSVIKVKRSNSKTNSGFYSTLVKE